MIQATFCISFTAGTSILNALIEVFHVKDNFVFLSLTNQFVGILHFLINVLGVVESLVP